MGYWDCKYCDTKKILGTERICPNCGRPRGKETKFYLDKSNLVELTSEQAETKNKGADWLCPFCDTLNSTLDNVCKSCGSPRTESKKDYFNMNDKEPEPEPEQDYKFKLHSDIPKKVIDWLWKIGIGALVVLAVSAVVWLFMPKISDFTVTEKSWQYTQKIESYETVRESDWSLPSSARLVDKKAEIHHYDSEFDHYETRIRQVSEQVLDGYDEVCSYDDNGDGSFSESCSDVPRYRTEYHTETYEEPVYKDVPVYATKYYYDIDKWIYKTSATSSGVNNEPYWKEVILKDNERIGEKIEEYWISGYKKKPTKIDKYKIDGGSWEQIEMGKIYEIKTSAGQLIDISAKN